VACEKCNVWQHSKCLGITKTEAEKDDFHFICKDCKQRIEDAKKPKISLKFRTGLSSSPTQSKSEGRPPGRETLVSVEVPKKRGPGRPPGTTRPVIQGSQKNGHTAPAIDQPGRSGGSAYFQQPMLNGYASHNGIQNPVGRPQQGWPYTNGFAQAGPAPNPPAMFSQSGYGAHPGSSGQPGSFGSPSNSSTYARPTSSHSQYLPYYNGIPYQYQNYPSQSPPSRPISSHSQNVHPAYHSTPHDTNNAHNASNARMSSPVLNRPMMSPTQGNHDVGPTAGVPQKSPGTSYAQPFAQQRTPGMYHSNGGSNYYPQTTPAPLSRSPNTNHMSGLSPTKHSPAVPQPAYIPKSSISPSPGGPGTFRSVSGTPIFPPAENLAPSPRQLSKSPVPTPSKNASPMQVAETELKRINMEAPTAMNLPQQVGQ
jgi:hypothetical protein